ncbi:MAG: hypothetical protein JRH10_14305 [Deltaproteobacteria bacterium]|nr:hypothetical protein [Deltaproteobacteria bacterium]MBW2445077.1 hypothetical protein [Deltaproteobacteria bacterium]
MANSLPQKGNFFPRASEAASARGVDRVASFRVIYAAIFAFAVLYVFSVEAAGWLLQGRFETSVAEAVAVDPTRVPATGVANEIRRGIRKNVTGSAWIRVGRVRVLAFVYGSDGVLIHPAPAILPGVLDPNAATREAARILPASYEVSVSVPHNSLLAVTILVGYAATLLWALFLYTRALGRQEERLLVEAENSRRDASNRAERIEQELEAARRKASEVDPASTPNAEEIRQLRAERLALQDKLAGLARREEELSSDHARNVELDEELHTLEELLDESLQDVENKNDEIETLRSRVQKAEKNAPEAKSSRASRDAEQLDRRLRTLYKNLEVDDRALSDLVALRDQTMQLKAEEALKRLSDEAENAAVRRKVGGLPPGLPCFEMGFAGKGRLYYTPGRARRFRLLCVGAKNTQKPDLEYLSKVVRET